MRKLRRKLGLDDTAAEAEILASVQQIIDRAALLGPADASDAGVTGSHAGDLMPTDCENQSRVEKIRMRVRELNDHYGDEITPKVMFDLIIDEFTNRDRRKD